MFATTFLGYTFSVFALMLGIVLWVALALLPAIIAKNKGHSFILWFLLSIFFWWITLFVALFMHDKRRPTGPYPV